jgi:hypothetical protein
MKPILTKAKWIDRTLIEAHFKIAVCISEKNFTFELKRLHIPEKDWPAWLEEGSSAETHTFKGTKKSKTERIIMVCIKLKEKDAISFLIHEAVHIYQDEIKLIEEKNPSDEFMAYSIQAIATNLIKAYSECK